MYSLPLHWLHHHVHYPCPLRHVSLVTNKTLTSQALFPTSCSQGRDGLLKLWSAVAAADMAPPSLLTQLETGSFAFCAAAVLEAVGSSEETIVCAPSSEASQVAWRGCHAVTHSLPSLLTMWALPASADRCVALEHKEHRLQAMSSDNWSQHWYIHRPHMRAACDCKLKHLPTAVIVPLLARHVHGDPGAAA